MTVDTAQTGTELETSTLSFLQTYYHFANTGE